MSAARDIEERAAHWVMRQGGIGLARRLGAELLAHD